MSFSSGRSKGNLSDSIKMAINQKGLKTFLRHSSVSCPVGRRFPSLVRVFVSRALPSFIPFVTVVCWCSSGVVVHTSLLRIIWSKYVQCQVKAKTRQDDNATRHMLSSSSSSSSSVMPPPPSTLLAFPIRGYIYRYAIFRRRPYTYMNIPAGCHLASLSVGYVVVCPHDSR